MSSINGDVKEAGPYLTKFEVDNVEPSKVHQRYYSSGPGHVAAQLSLYMKSGCGEIIQGTTFPKNNILPSDNGFVNAVTKAYDQHHHLVIRPDDIWQAIMTQFSFYLNAQAEKFRGKFVNFEGKKQMEVVEPIGNVRTVSYESLVTKMEAKIDMNLVDPEVRGWIMPNFSTTTPDDRVTAGVVFMAAMKKYFDYTFRGGCGLPSVTLDGTVADYEEIRRRLDKLETYELKDWGQMLKPILEQFVMAKNGNPDKKFWSRICHFEGQDGSGQGEIRTLSGWITAFILFDQDGKKQGWYEDGKEWPIVAASTIPSGVVEVDVTMIDETTKTVYQTVMLAGSMAMEIGQGGYSLQPKSGWIIAFKKERLEPRVFNRR